MQETQEILVQSLGREDLLEEGMATHSSILAWRIPWTEEPGGLQSTGLHTTEWLTLSLLIYVQAAVPLRGHKEHQEGKGSRCLEGHGYGLNACVPPKCTR